MTGNERDEVAHRANLREAFVGDDHSESFFERQRGSDEREWKSAQIDVEAGSRHDMLDRDLELGREDRRHRLGERTFRIHAESSVDRVQALPPNAVVVGVTWSTPGSRACTRRRRLTDMRAIPGAA